MMDSIVRIIQIVAIIGTFSSWIYYLLCLWSAARFFHEGKVEQDIYTEQSSPPISILKPLKGVDPEIYESFRSHCLQDYPEYEIIFGVSDPNDPAIESKEIAARISRSQNSVAGVFENPGHEREGQQPGANAGGSSL